MKRLLLILIVLSCSACVSSTDPRSHTVRYLHDYRTGLCFAVMYANSAVVVPCSDQVIAIAINEADY